MCGIAGIIGGTFTSEQRLAQLEQVKSALTHRGPDDVGYWCDTKTNIAAFGHTRLSIIDLSRAGRQPMQDSSGRYTIVFNGEIYNYKQLRNDLIDKGAIFQSSSDTEVILELYKHEGLASLNRLRGMFAFAIWDTTEQSILLVRDPLGIKPLYYYRNSNCIAFSSEFRALLAAGLSKRTINPKALQLYLATGSVPCPYTLDEQLHQLSPGHYLYWKNGSSSLHAYWTPTFPDEPIHTDQTTSASVLRNALIDSIEHHFVSDVPVAICLSGGLDSTSLVAISHTIGKRDIHTFSIGFPHKEINEADIAAKTAMHFGCQHHEWNIGNDEVGQLSQSFLKSVDQPSIDGFNSFLIAYLINKSGLKVALSGLGGDELFGSYQSFNIIPKLLRLSAITKKIPFSQQILSKLLTSTATQARMRRLGSYLHGRQNLISAYSSVRGIFSLHESIIITKQFCNNFEVFDFTHSAECELQSKDLGNSISILELTNYMQNQLLRDSDVMSMRHGVEFRVPFIDAHLFKTIRDISPTIRLAPGKEILKQAVPEIPSWVLEQPKRGFVLPYHDWLTKELKVQTPASFAGVKLTNWYQHWSLHVLHHFIVSNGLTGL